MPTPPPTRRPLLPYILLALITILTFAPCARNAFTTWDDNDTIARNPDLNPVTPTSFAHFWTSPQGDLYIPVTYTLWAALTSLARTSHPDPTGLTLSPAVYHTFNIFLHTATTLLAYELLRRLTHKPWAAMLGALLFALHPVQVETVAWASGTKDLLAGLFSLAALNFYTAAQQHSPTIAPDHDDDDQPCDPPAPRRGAAQRSRRISFARPTRRTRPTLFSAATVCFLLALLSKPSCVALPFAAIAIAHFLLRQPWRRALLPVLPWLLLALPAVLVGRWAQPAHVLPYVPPLYLRPIVAADAIGFYLQKLLLPLHLAVDYGRTPRAVLSSPFTLYTTLTAATFLLILYLFRRSRPLLTAASLSLAAILPVLGLIPFDFQQYSTTSDHYLYLALLGPALLLTSLLPKNSLDIPSPLAATPRVARPQFSPEPISIAPSKFFRHPLPLATLTALAVLAARSFAQTTHWADSSTLFTHTLTVNPNSPAARVNLAIDLMNHNHPDQAVAQYRALLSTDPANPKAHLGLGQVLARTGHPQPALAHLRTAASLQPDNPLTHYNLALLLTSLGRQDEALAAYHRALSLEPNFPEAHTNLATLLLSRGDLDAAERHYRTALQIRPSLTLPQRGLQTIAQLRASQPPTTHP